MVGNDIVDLAEAGEPSPRFLLRVLAPEERDVARRGGVRAFWRLWSAKEAAYKALARRDPELAFAHARFRVDDDVVHHELGSLPVRWEERPEAIACVAADRDVVTRVAALAELPEEDAAPILRPSLAARRLARRMLSERLGLEPDELEIVRPDRGPGRRRGAPEVWWRGRRRGDVVVSLAHDGGFVACAAHVDG